MIELEHNYYKTMPIHQQKMKNEENKVQDYRTKRIIKQSRNSRDDTNSNLGKSLFQISPRKSPQNNAIMRRSTQQ